MSKQISAELQDALDRAADGGRIEYEEALELYRHAPLHALGTAADAARRKRYSGVYGEHEIATYIIERNINYTNACVTACKFCAFYAAPKSDKVWSARSRTSCAAARRPSPSAARRSCSRAATTRTTGSSTTRRTSAPSRPEFPQLVIHSLGASEVQHMAKVSGVDHRRGHHPPEGLRPGLLRRCRRRAAAARPRTAIAPLKESGERWLEIMETAHGLGLECTSTMLMGTGETNAERIEHLRMIRDVQDRTGGFRAFIPYTYQPENNHLKGRTQATMFEYLRLIAIARLYLHNVAHIQGSWLTVGKEAGQLSLHYGADDLGSVMLEENVVSSAGAKHRSNRMELIHLIRAAGRVPAQRSTTYNLITVHDDPANDPVDDHVMSHIASTAIAGGTAHPELKLVDVR